MSDPIKSDSPDGAVDLPRFVRGWADLAEVPESETHYLEIEVEHCNGWIKDKRDPEALGHYLSTHTFYGSNYIHSTQRLRRCGFNVSLANWDAPNTKARDRSEGELPPKSQDSKL